MDQDDGGWCRNDMEEDTGNNPLIRGLDSSWDIRMLENWRLYSGGAAWIASNTAVNDGLWHHVGVVLAGTSVSFYRDGVLDATQGTNVPNSYTGARAIGSASFSGSSVNGSLDEVAIWNTNLSTAQIQLIYNRQKIICSWRN